MKVLLLSTFFVSIFVLGHFNFDQNVFFQLLMTVPRLLFLKFYQGTFLPWNERRSGKVQLNDPLLTKVPHLPDYSKEVFFLTYGAVVAWIVYAAFQGSLFFLACVQSFCYTAFFRCIAMFLTPLKAPDNVRPLQDFLANANTVPMQDDLFFSGHTSMLFLPIFTNTVDKIVDKVFQFLHIVATLLVIVFMYKSNVHYTTDIYCAPFFSYTAYRLAWGTDFWSTLFSATIDFLCFLVAIRSNGRRSGGSRVS
jgi:hypothetical protein